MACSLLALAAVESALVHDRALPCWNVRRGVVDKLPFFGDFFELVGLAVLGTYAYRYITDPSER
jgi:hypothetical protein